MTGLQWALLLVGGLVGLGWIVAALVTWLESDELFKHYGNPFDRRG